MPRNSRQSEEAATTPRIIGVIARACIALALSSLKRIDSGTATIA
jgi:hypothetical protein